MKVEAVLVQITIRTILVVIGQDQVVGPVVGLEVTQAPDLAAVVAIQVALAKTKVIIIAVVQVKRKKKVNKMLLMTATTMIRNLCLLLFLR